MDCNFHCHCEEMMLQPLESIAAICQWMFVSRVKNAGIKGRNVFSIFLLWSQAIVWVTNLTSFQAFSGIFSEQMLFSKKSAHERMNVCSVLSFGSQFT